MIRLLPDDDLGQSVLRGRRRSDGRDGVQLPRRSLPTLRHTGPLRTLRYFSHYPQRIDVKNGVFTFFFILVTFSYVFKRFLFNFPNVFSFKKNVGKVQSGKQINKEHFRNNSNETDL